MHEHLMLHSDIQKIGWSYFIFHETQVSKKKNQKSDDSNWIWEKEWKILIQGSSSDISINPQ